MKFEEVLPALREGKKIRRKDIGWENYYGFLFISETENEIFSDSVRNYYYEIKKFLKQNQIDCFLRKSHFKGICNAGGRPINL